MERVGREKLEGGRRERELDEIDERMEKEKG